MKNILFFLFVLITPLIVFSQASEEEQLVIDSLKQVIASNTHDSNKVNAYFDWDNIIYISDPALDVKINNKILQLCEKKLKASLSKKESKFYKNFLSNAHNVLALNYANNGSFSQALKQHQKSLVIDVELNDLVGISNTYNNIGLIFSDMGESSKAMEYYQKSLALKLKTEDSLNISSAYSNMGTILEEEGKQDEAMAYYQKSLRLDRINNDTEGIIVSLINIGNIYFENKAFDKALSNYNQGLELSKEIGSEQGIALTLNAISSVYFEQKKYTKAIELSLIAKKKAISHGGIFGLHDATYMLYQCYSLLGKHNYALKMHENYVVLKDSIASKANQKELIRQEFKFSYDKQKAIDDSKHEQELFLSSEQEKKQKLISLFVAGGLFLVLIFSIVIFNRLRITKKQKLIIENQKHIVEEKNQEITDSIQYAKRIQNAILPPKKVVKEFLPNSFVLYKPKDIVAGDFYWLEAVLGNELREVSDEKSPTPATHPSPLTLFAAADCTGHGVPGAMVSVICNNALNRSVREHHLTDPGEILTKTREIVVQEFEKSDEDVKDGMDIALCSLEDNSPFKGGERGMLLKYAGAHNPLWIVRSVRHPELVSESNQTLNQVQGDDYILFEIKANKQPIGQFDNPQPYTTHSFELEKGDTVYIFSDGYVDQFGGEKGKKFKAANFKKLLLSIQQESMEKQLVLIDEMFEKWRGDLEQLDDVCVIGVKI